MAKTPYLDLREDFNRNYIINGNFDFWQRGTSLSTDGYLADRFIYVGSPDGGTAASYTISRQNFAVADAPVKEFGETQHYWRIANSTQGTSLGVNSNHTVTTKPEGVGLLAGKLITVTFWARSSIAGKVIMMKPARRFGAGGSSNDDTEIAGKRFTLSADWQKYTTTFQMPILDGKVVGTGSHLRFTWVFQVGSTLAAQYDGGAAITWQGTGTTDIAQIQVAEGAEALPFRLAGKSLADELALCQRYYQKLTRDSVSTSPLGEAVAISTTRALGSTSLPVPMRSKPTLAATAANMSLSTGSGVALTSISLRSFTSDSIAELDMNVASGLTNNQAYRIMLDASGASVAFDAEL